MAVDVSERNRKAREYYALHRDRKIAITRAWQARNPEKTKAIIAKWGKAFGRRARLKREYGISESDYDRMLDEQHGVCAICELPETRLSRHTERPMRLAIDHSHETGEIRGLLCHRCNTILGSTYDNPVLLMRLAKYLARQRGGSHGSTL